MPPPINLKQKQSHSGIVNTAAMHVARVIWTERSGLPPKLLLKTAAVTPHGGSVCNASRAFSGVEIGRNVAAAKNMHGKISILTAVADKTHFH